MSSTGYVAALRAEASSLGPGRPRPDGLVQLSSGGLLVTTGMGAAAAAEGARRLLGAGCSSLVSFGMAGGLAPTLAAGTVLLPAEVRNEAGASFATTAGWRQQVAQRLLRAGLEVQHEACSMLSVATPLASILEKARAHDQGAIGVDMESAAIAAVAADGDRSLLVVRVVTDTARDELPRSVTVSLDARGEIRLPRLLAALLRQPSDIAPLLALARRYGAARRSLVTSARAGLARE